MALLQSLRKNQGALGDLLLGGGLGLLSQGPSLRPTSPWQGLGTGLMMGRQMTADRRSQAIEEEKLEMMRQKAAAAAAKAGAPSYKHFPGIGVFNINAPGGIEQVLDPAAPKDPLAQFTAYQNLDPAAQEAFQEYKKAGAMNINLESQKPLLDDAPQWRNAGGASPPPMMTGIDAYAAGFSPMGKSEQAAETKRATETSTLELLDAELERAEAIRAAAKEAFDADPNPITRRDLDQAANAVSTAKAGRANWRGEPSGEVARRFQEPSAVGGAIESGVGGIVDRLRSLVSDSQQAPQQQAAPVQQGAIETDESGQQYQFIGGDPADPSRWVPMP